MVKIGKPAHNEIVGKVYLREKTCKKQSIWVFFTDFYVKTNVIFAGIYLFDSFNRIVYAIVPKIFEKVDEILYKKYQMLKMIINRTNFVIKWQDNIELII